jgi:hypothetical protein
MMTKEMKCDFLMIRKAKKMMSEYFIFSGIMILIDRE